MVVADEPQPQAQAFPLGLEDKLPDGLPAAVVTHRGCRLVLRFAPGDVLAEGPLQELCVRPDTAELTPRALREFAKHADTYVAYARAAVRILGPDGTAEERWNKLRGTTDALREIGGPGRGHDDEFYKQIAAQYLALVDGDEPHPVKTLGEMNHIQISGASRWITEARRRGFLPKKK